jgi:RNA polymerase sigma-70 factor (ECF subfamily)
MNPFRASTASPAERTAGTLTQRSHMEEKPSFLAVFDAEESPLLRYAHGLVGQRETAEDLVQDAFLKLHHHWDDVSNPRAWLFRSVRNLAFNHLRDHKRELPADPDREWASNHPDPDRELGRMETIGTLRLLIAELPEPDRTLIELKYDENLHYEQISQRTGLSVGNVGYKLHHLMKRLADSLRQLGVESAEL